jgi:hypothetical protein
MENIEENYLEDTGYIYIFVLKQSIAFLRGFVTSAYFINKQQRLSVATKLFQERVLDLKLRRFVTVNEPKIVTDLIFEYIFLCACYL